MLVCAARMENIMSSSSIEHDQEEWQHETNEGPFVDVDITPTNVVLLLVGRNTLCISFLLCACTRIPKQGRQRQQYQRKGEAIKEKSVQSQMNIIKRPPFAVLVPVIVMIFTMVIFVMIIFTMIPIGVVTLGWGEFKRLVDLVAKQEIVQCYHTQSEED